MITPVIKIVYDVGRGRRSKMLIPFYEIGSKNELELVIEKIRANLTIKKPKRPLCSIKLYHHNSTGEKYDEGKSYPYKIVKEINNKYYS